MSTSPPRSRHRFAPALAAPTFAVAAFALACALAACGDDALPASDLALPDGGAADLGPRCPVALDKPAPGVVLVETGAVQGVESGATWSWKGIPYAAPPVGALRFRAPAEPACLEGVRLAAQFGPRCPQLDDNGDVLGAEDCLTLNIWAPKSPPPKLLPVMFFIHGGGNVQGWSGDAVYDGRFLAERAGVVVVTINYRLAQMGFLAHPALDKESPRGVSGNWGTLDQIAALQFVQRNIERFGGDPRNVMIFGESAGGVNVCVLVASPLAAGLFHRALMQSGGCGARPLAVDEQLGAEVVTAANCSGSPDVAACLRGRSMAEIVRAAGTTASGLVSSGFGPTVDGWVLPRSPVEALRAGTHNHVPFVVGANADETARMVPAVTSEAEYKAAVVKLYGQGVADKTVPQYPVSEYGTPRKALIALTTDGRFVCPARKWTRAALAGQSDQPVYRYFFTHALDNLPPATNPGAFHGLELPFIFRTIGGGSGAYTPSAGDLALADAMMGYWTRFAAAGDPNGSGATPWPRYAPGSDRYLRLGDPVTAGDGVRTAKCDFWDSITP